MAAKKESNIPADRLEDYERLVATNPDLKRKGATMPYTSCNGHMFSYLEKDGSLGIRLPEEAREAFLKKYKTTLFESFGMVMKEYVLVPDKLVKKTKELQPYFDMGYEYVKGLKPKPTKKAIKKI